MSDNQIGFPTFSFVIVTYESQDTIESCLESLSRHNTKSFEIKIIDNSTTWLTIDAIRQFQLRHPDLSVEVVKPQTNLGFAAACNIGARASQGEFLFFLNPDTELLNDAASALASCLQEHSEAVAAGPMILNTDGTVTRTCRYLPTLWRILLDMSGLDRCVGKYKMTRFTHRDARSVEQIIGAALFIRRRSFDEIGGFDERFFIYFEEVDLCKRLIESGKTIWFWPAAQVRHLAGISCEANPVRARMICTLRRSRTAYFRKHFGTRGWIGIKVLNTLEGIAKGVVFSCIFALSQKTKYGERAKGFWSVAVGCSTISTRPKRVRVLAFTVKPTESADTRYRLLQFKENAEKANIEIDHRSLISSAYFGWQIRNEQLFLRAFLYPGLLIRRLWQVLYLAPRYDAIWISREMNPLGPPLFERLLVSRCKRVIFDVDDALHLPDVKGSRILSHVLRDRDKFGRLAAFYSVVICGNQNLASYYQQYSRQVEVIPTVVDSTEYGKVKPRSGSVPRIGWIGTPLNKQHLESLASVFTQLAEERAFELVVVGLNESLGWYIPSVRYLEWNLRDEINFFTHFDIGIMPLRDSPFARGKCAFKLVQYMASGIPVVASPVGANCDLVESGRNGFLADTSAEWIDALRTLIDDPHLREEMGENGRRLIERSYSVSSVWPRYLRIFGADGRMSECAE